MDHGSTYFPITLSYCSILKRADSSVFLDPEVNYLLKQLSEYICSGHSLETLQLALRISIGVPQITRFYELFTSLLDQFESSSYGDQTFATFLLIPIIQKFPRIFRYFSLIF